MKQLRARGLYRPPSTNMSTQIFTALDFRACFFGGLFLSISLAIACYGRPYVIFAYNCFLKPFTNPSEKGSAGGQQDALESFYKGQAAIYDSTRAWLLRGREEMLALAAAQLRLKNEREGFRKRVWVDVGFFSSFLSNCCL